MERSFYNDDFDFEQLIKQKSDQYRIYPSDKVWKGIHGTFHSSRRWYWMSFVLFIAGISYYAIDQLSAPARKELIASKNNSTPDISKNPSANQAIILPFNNPLIGQAKPAAADNYTRKGLVSTQETEAYPLFGKDIITGTRGIETDTYSDQTKAPPFSIMEGVTPRSSIQGSHKEFVTALFTEKGNVIQELAENKVSRMDERIVASNNELTDQKRINWLQENAIYELTRPKTKRISWQLTLSPTRNYRKLTGDKNANIASDVRNVPISLTIEGDIDHLVNHKPALGFQLGSMFLYAISNTLTFKSGIQFNYSRYNIQAYSSYSTDRATIALNNFYGTNTDSITTYTSLRNFGGNAVKDLKNEYFQLSAPIGVEIRVFGRGKLQFSVAGTIQPTYLINRDNYLITTDYKNYTHEPSLVRRWNVNTGAEAFVSYKAGGLKFQLGPELRYQLLSSYDEKYPIKEFLTEYGIKFGVSKTIR